MKTKCSLPIVIMVAIVTLFHTSARAGIYDATLRNQGTESSASTMSMIERLFSRDNTIVKMATVEIAPKITMAWDEFTMGFGGSLYELNQKYNTFASFDANTILDQIVPKLYSKLLDPNKPITTSRWNTATKGWERWTRMPYPGEEGIFFPGWEEPVMSVKCWNFGYPNQNPVIGGALNGNIHVYDTLGIGRGGIQITTPTALS